MPYHDESMAYQGEWVPGIDVKIRSTERCTPISSGVLNNYSELAEPLQSPPSLIQSSLVKSSLVKSSVRRPIVVTKKLEDVPTASDLNAWKRHLASSKLWVKCFKCAIAGESDLKCVACGGAGSWLRTKAPARCPGCAGAGVVLRASSIDRPSPRPATCEGCGGSGAVRKFKIPSAIPGHPTRFPVADMIVLRDHNDYRDILAEAKAVGTDTAEEHGTELRPELEAAEGTNEPERSIRSFWRPALRFSTDVDVPSRVMKQPTPPSTPRRVAALGMYDHTGSSLRPRPASARPKSARPASSSSPAPKTLVRGLPSEFEGRFLGVLISPARTQSPPREKPVARPYVRPWAGDALAPQKPLPAQWRQPYMPPPPKPKPKPTPRTRKRLGESRHMAAAATIQRMLRARNEYREQKGAAMTIQRQLRSRGEYRHQKGAAITIQRQLRTRVEYREQTGAAKTIQRQRRSRVEYREQSGAAKTIQRQIRSRVEYREQTGAATTIQRNYRGRAPHCDDEAELRAPPVIMDRASAKARISGMHRLPGEPPAQPAAVRESRGAENLDDAHVVATIEPQLDGTVIISLREP